MYVEKIFTIVLKWGRVKGHKGKHGFYWTGKMTPVDHKIYYILKYIKHITHVISGATSKINLIFKNCIKKYTQKQYKEIEMAF